MVDFSGGNITSNGGVLLLKQAYAKLELTHDVAQTLPDIRRQASVRHTSEQMLRQRIYAIVAKRILMITMNFGMILLCKRLSVAIS